ncbi:14877_t:CDS:2 [Rhizophagus irregularis]|nr:14877_t:CDS:2 [Rhizophagus irregularis]
MLVHALPAHEDFRLMERCNIIINRRLSTRDCDEQKLNEDCSQECAHGPKCREDPISHTFSCKDN